MKKILILFMTVLFSLFLLTGCSEENNIEQETETPEVTTPEVTTPENKTPENNPEDKTPEVNTPNNGGNDSKEEIDFTNYVVTMRDIADFLQTKEEHYPLSDKFVEDYQQKSGGYIDNAKKAGILVDAKQHSPNQKWHFFESWLYPSIEDGSLTWDESAKSRVYSKLLCPELLLWIYEACEVDEAKVEAAMNAAIEGKENGTHSATLAKNMRACVAWEDLRPAIINFLADNLDAPSYLVQLNLEDGVEVSGIKTEYKYRSVVTFTVNVTNPDKAINEVSVDGSILTPVSEGNYKFTMPNNEVIVKVTLKDKPVNNPVIPGEKLSATYNVIYDLGTRKTAKQLTTEEEILAALVYSEEGSSIISSISGFEYIYGGGNGGSGDNKWYTGNMLKFGTTSVNGMLKISLTTAVNKVIITGYTTNNASKIEVGNPNSLISYTCEDMNLSIKDNIEANLVSTISFTFEATNEVVIKTTNNKPIYITSITFIYE